MMLPPPGCPVGGSGGLEEPAPLGGTGGPLRPAIGPGRLGAAGPAYRLPRALAAALMAVGGPPVGPAPWHGRPAARAPIAPGGPSRTHSCEPIEAVGVGLGQAGLLEWRGTSFLAGTRLAGLLECIGLGDRQRFQAGTFARGALGCGLRKTRSTRGLGFLPTSRAGLGPAFGPPVLAETGSTLELVSCSGLGRATRVPRWNPGGERGSAGIGPRVDSFPLPRPGGAA